MRVLFVGSVEFSNQLLRTLLTIHEVKIVGIITKSKSVFNADHVDLSFHALDHDIPFKYVKDINAPHIVSWISSLQADAIFCFGWSALIKEELIEIPPKGIVGYHPALLPENRGRHPLIWALALGLKKTGSTFFLMDGGADSGSIVHQQEVEIDNTDNARTLYDKMVYIAQSQLKSWVPLMCEDKLNITKQDHSQANYWRKRSKEDGKIDFRMNTITIYNLVRSLTNPYVGAHVVFLNDEFKVWACESGKELPSNIEPGKIIAVTLDGITVKTADGSITLTKHELPAEVKPRDYLE